MHFRQLQSNSAENGNENSHGRTQKICFAGPHERRKHIKTTNWYPSKRSTARKYPGGEQKPKSKANALLHG